MGILETILMMFALAGFVHLSVTVVATVYEFLPRKKERNVIRVKHSRNA